MDNIFVILIIGLGFYLLHKRISKIEGKSNSDNIFPFSQKLYFNLHHSIVFSQLVLDRAGVTKKEIDKGYDKWTKSFKDKWYGFLNNKNTQLGSTQTDFNLTYLANDNMFIIEDDDDTYVVPNRTPPNNTRLFDHTLLFYPNKNADFRQDELRLEVDLRDEVFENNTFCLITVGIREFENTKAIPKSKYTKLFDFPFSQPFTNTVISDGEYKKFGFEVKRPSPWYNKDDFGKTTAHPWDTEIVYKHESGAEINWLV